jgi:surface-anchored protein
MKIIYIAGTLLIGTGRLAAGLAPLGEHVDILWTYMSATDQWTGQAKTAGTGGDVMWEFDDVFFPLSDKPYSATTPSNSGARNTQPSSSAYAFTGVAEGEPLWIAVQGTPGVGEVWPGFENNQAAGTLGSYFETDTRLPQPQTTAREWITVHLKNVSYQGTGANPAFSVWTVSGGVPRVWMATADGIGEDDLHLFAIPSHNHVNWGFGALGIYRIQITATAYKGPGQTNPTAESEIHTLTFAVGPFARWQAENFSSSELDSPAISGPNADPDKDGMVNLVEFAFGFDPESGVATPVAEGLGLPKLSVVEDAGEFFEVLEYPRRRAGSLISPLIYSPQFSASFDWQSDGVITTTDDFPSGQDALNEEWELVTSRRPVGISAPARGFARVELKNEE